MTIGRVAGPSLFSNLDREGIDLQFTTTGNPLLYLDFTNFRAAINANTQTATETLTINGNLKLSNFKLDNYTISSSSNLVLDYPGILTLGNASSAFTTIDATGVLTVSNNILPLTNNVTNIGSPTNRFNAIYVNEAHLAGSTLYLADTPILSIANNTIDIFADPGQNLSITTSAAGSLSITSNTEIISYTVGSNAHNIIQSSGIGSKTKLLSDTAIELTTPEITSSGNLTVTGLTTASGDMVIGGNLTVTGNIVAIDTINLSVRDPILVLNSAETGNVVTYGTSGLYFERGSGQSYALVYQESDKSLQFGPLGSTIAMADKPWVIANYVANYSTSTLGNLTITNNLTMLNSNPTNFSTANAVITGGSIDSTPIGSLGPSTGHFTTLISNSGITGTLQTAAQPNVTSVGTLTSLNVAGTTTSGNVVTTNVTGTLLTPAQPNVTSVGNLTGLRVIATITGNISGSASTVTSAAQPAITSLGTLTGLTVSGTTYSGLFNGPLIGSVLGDITGNVLGNLTGNVTGNLTGNVTGQILTPAQTHITSVGTLTGLTVTAMITGSVSGTASTVTSAAQPTITSVGTLTGLTSSGIVDITNTTNSTTSLNGALIVAGGVGIGNNLNVGNNLTVGGDVTISGNITIGGGNTSISTTNLTVTDSFIYLANENPADSVSIGFVADYQNQANVNAHTGLIRDPSTKDYYLFDGYLLQPGPSNINVSDPSFTLTNLHVGNLLSNGNVTSTSTTTGAIQTLGGVGIAKDIYVGGNITVQNITGTNSTLTGLSDHSEKQGDQFVISEDTSILRTGSWSVTASGNLYTLLGNQLAMTYWSHNVGLDNNGNFLGTDDSGTATLWTFSENDQYNIYSAPSVLANVIPTFGATPTFGFNVPTGDLALTGTMQSTQFTSTIPTGTAPLIVSSTTNVPNLNASSLNGATFAAPGPIGSGTASTGAFTTVSATTFTGNIIGSITGTTASFTGLDVRTKQGDQFDISADSSVLRNGTWSSTASGNLYALLGNNLAMTYWSHNVQLDTNGNFLGTDDSGTSTVWAYTENDFVNIYSAPFVSANTIPTFGATPTQSFDTANGVMSITGSMTAPNFISSVSTGTAPFTVSSTTPVDNLSINGTALTATNAINVGITNDTTSILTVYPMWSTVSSGNIATKVSNTKLSFVPNTGTLAATTFSGSGALLTNIPNGALTNNTVTVNTSTGLAGGGTIALGGNITLTNTGVTQITNGGHITVSAATGAITLGSDATTANTPSTIVARDASGNFNAGTITASLSGTASNSNTVGTFTPSQTAGTLNRVVVADGSGYIPNTYFVSSDNSPSTGNPGTTSGVTSVMVKAGSNSLVSASPAAISTFLGLTNSATIAATPANTPTTIIERDSSGSFSAGTITANLFSGSGASLTSIPNGALVNSSTTIGNTTIALGASSTTLAGLTNVSSTIFTGNVTGSAATVTAFAQPAITSVGTLTGLNVSGATSLSDTTILGNLSVTGTTTTINSTTVSTTDLNITLASNAISAAAANGAGITVHGPVTPATLLYANGDDSWNFNKKLSAVSFYGSGVGLTSIPNSALVNSSTTIGNTTIALGASSTAINGLTSITSTTFNGNVTGNVIGNVTGNVTGNLTGNVLTAAQPTITSVGNLILLNVTGTTTSGLFSGSLVGDVLGNITGNVSGTASTVTANAQPNITSVGTLGTLVVTGNVLIGSPTGGAMGAGTINATGLFVNGSAIGIGGSFDGGTVHQITNFSNAATSTSTTTGAVIVTGGLGVQGNINATSISATTLNATTANITSGLLGNLTVSGNVALTSNTNSISSTTGALVVTGGAGIAKDLTIGGNVVVTGTVTSSTVPYSGIAGFLLSAMTGTNTTASFTVSAGQATALQGSATSQTTQITKTTTTSWAASNGNAINGTDAASSTLANSATYHVYMCSGASGTGSFVSASLTPTFPTGYAVSARRIASFNTTAGGAPIPYTSIEINGGGVLNWLTTQTLDIATTTLSTSRIAYTLNVPTGIKVQPIFRFSQSQGAQGTVIFTSGDETDVAPTANGANGWTTAPGGDSMLTPYFESVGGAPILTTNTSGQIGARSTSAGTYMYAVTRGYIDFRRA